MKQKGIVWTTLVLMVLTFLYMAADKYYFTPAAHAQYTVTVWMLLDVFAARPLFYTSLGLLSGFRLFGQVKEARTRRILLICGAVLALIFLGVAIAAIAGVEFRLFLFELLRQLFQLPAVFLVPGLLLGLGLRDPQ